MGQACYPGSGDKIANCTLWISEAAEIMILNRWESRR